MPKCFGRLTLRTRVFGSSGVRYDSQNTVLSWVPMCFHDGAFDSPNACHDDSDKEVEGFHIWCSTRLPWPSVTYPILSFQRSCMTCLPRRHDSVRRLPVPIVLDNLLGRCHRLESKRVSTDKHIPSQRCPKRDTKTSHKVSHACTHGRWAHSTESSLKKFSTQTCGLWDERWFQKRFLGAAERSICASGDHHDWVWSDVSRIHRNS